MWSLKTEGPCVSEVSTEDCRAALLFSDLSGQEFCQNLKELNFREDLMSPDDVELLIHVLPTPEENKKLSPRHGESKLSPGARIEYRDRVQDLRDAIPPAGQQLHASFMSWLKASQKPCTTAGTSWHSLQCSLGRKIAV